MSFESQKTALFEHGVTVLEHGVTVLERGVTLKERVGFGLNFTLNQSYHLEFPQIHELFFEPCFRQKVPLKLSIHGHRGV